MAPDATNCVFINRHKFGGITILMLPLFNSVKLFYTYYYGQQGSHTENEG